MPVSVSGALLGPRDVKMTKTQSLLSGSTQTQEEHKNSGNISEKWEVSGIIKCVFGSTENQYVDKFLVNVKLKLS